MPINPKEAYDAILKEVGVHISGNVETIKLILMAIVADGHVLLEGVPGVAKTTMTRTIAETIDAEFSRIEGTAELQIKDVIGYTYIDESHNVQLKKGPIFTNLLLIDELNRAPATTTTALLEALEEKRVTIGNYDTELKRPFIAFATQNPLNIEGTQPLPKVLSDRFIMRIGVTYASGEEEVEMLRIKEKNANTKTQKILSIDQVIELQEMAKTVTMPDEVANFIVRLVDITRQEIHVVMGGSPRAEISFMRVAKAKALLEGRSETSIDDIKYLARAVLSHRITVKSTGGLGVNGIIDGIIATIK
jgi:MoxR-like ATPase